MGKGYIFHRMQKEKNGFDPSKLCSNLVFHENVIFFYRNHLNAIAVVCNLFFIYLAFFCYKFGSVLYIKTVWIIVWACNFSYKKIKIYTPNV